MSVLPIVDRELRVAARRAGTYWMRAGAAFAMLVIYLVVLWNSNFRSPAKLGHNLLVGMGALALTTSMLAGIFLTSDSLSEEKREGTLGLLFLTHLRAHDVVLGKMVAHSLHAFFGLLAVLPILGLTLFLGGVTGLEFARVALVFVTTLFFSLSLGMGMSALCREARQAIAGTFLLMILFAGLFPGLWWLYWLWFKQWQDWLLLPCPIFAYTSGLDGAYQVGHNATLFWCSIATLFLLGVGALVLAAKMLPRGWKERGEVQQVEMKRFQWLEGMARKRRFMALLPDTNPAYWLAARDPAPNRAAWRIMMILGGFWIIALLISVDEMLTGPRQGAAFIIAVAVGYLMHLMIKIMVASEAGRRLNHDRRSGALELLLVTPMQVDTFLVGQMKGLRRLFRGVIIALCLMNIAMEVVVIRLENHFGSIEQLWIFSELLLGGMLVLLTDFYSLTWVGMWRGLKARQHHNAVLGTLGQILGPGYLTMFIIILLIPAFGASAGVVFLIWLWLIVFMFVGVASGNAARSHLHEDFRATVLLKQ